MVCAEREKIALDFLDGLGLAEHIKKLKVSCMMKDVAKSSWTNVCIKTFPSVSNLVYYSSFNKGNRYEPLTLSNEVIWENLENVSVYFDTSALISLIQTHNTISSFSFSPKFSDSMFIEALSQNLSLLNNVQAIDIDFKFDFTQIEKSPLLPKFQSLIIDPPGKMDDKFIGTALTHLTKLALDNSEPLPLTLRNITFQIMKELTISYPSNTNIMVNIENVTIPNLEKLSMQCACINTAGKNQFPNLQSLNFHHCKFDSSFWIDSHRTISTIALSEIELGSLSSSIRQVVIDSHPSIEIVFVSCFDDISILNCPSLKKAYIERCKKPEKLQDIISSFKKIHNLKCTVSEEHSYIIEQLKDQPSTKYDNVSKLSSLATKIVTHSQEFDVGSTLKNCQRLQSLTSSSQLN